MVRPKAVSSLPRQRELYYRFGKLGFNCVRTTARWPGWP